MYKILVLLFVILLGSAQAFAEEYYSVGPGPDDWEDAGTWSPGTGPPGCGDTVYIQAGHHVYVSGVIDHSSPGCGQPMFVEVYGELEFDGGGSKLRLPGGSGVRVGPAGSIYASGGGSGSSKTIEIGGVTVWDANDPPVGPGEGFGSPLADFLIYFKGTYFPTHVLLDWQTEGNSNGSYILEKSFDGINFEELKEVSAELHQGISYRVKDFDADFDKAFYRLTYRNLNNEFFPLETIVVLSDVSEHFNFKVIPNPTDGRIINLAIGTPEPKTVHAIVSDINGHMVYNDVLSLSSGNNLYSLYTQLEVFGMVYVTLFDDRHKATEKVVISK